MRLARPAPIILACTVLLAGCRAPVSDSTERDVAPPRTPESSASSDAVRLVDVLSGGSNVLLLEPTLLPAGYQECQRRDAAGRVYIGYCDERRDLALEIEQLSISPERGSGEPVANLRSAFWTSTGDNTLSLAAPLGPGAWLQVSASDLTPPQVARVAASIPIIGQRGSLYPEYRLPLDVSQVTVDDVSAWFAKSAEDIYFEIDQSGNLLVGSGFGGPGGVQLSTSDAAITNAVRVFAQEIHQPRLLGDLTIPTVGGEAPDGLSRVAWSAGAVFWYLQGHMPLIELADVAERIQASLDTAS